MRNVFFVKFFQIIIVIVFASVGVYAANLSHSTEQALEQLKLLRTRMDQPSNSGQQNSDNLPKVAEVSRTSNAKKTAKASESLQSVTPANPVTAPVTSGSMDTMDTDNAIIPDNEMIDERGFAGIKRQLFPLDPEHIVQLKGLYQESEQANASTVGAPPKPTATSQFVNLSPGSTPPVIRLAQGFVTSLVFLDSTGTDWPISAYDLGDPTAFNIQWDRTSNTLMIQALKLYTYGNLAVRLKDLHTPVMLTLIPGQKAVDYRVDLRIQGYGPNAKNLPLEEGLPPSASDVLLHILEGVPPNGSRRLFITGGDARAWILDNKIYVRTNLTILSPGWLASMTSADGMHAYEMQKSPVLLVSWHGKVMQLKVEGL